jgi:hypothetical protein
MTTKSTKPVSGATEAAGELAEPRGGGPSPSDGARPPRRGARRNPGAPPSNTAPAKYQDRSAACRVLRYQVDSLYVSYPGTLFPEWETRLEGLKEAARSESDSVRATAQVPIEQHLFEVSAKGRKRCRFVLADNCFDIGVAGVSARSVPMAYVQIGSEYLTAVGVDLAIAQLTPMIQRLGTVPQYRPPNVSRVDLCVDFTTDIDPESWPRDCWITRADDIDQKARRGRFSGWIIGEGGVVMARLYDKTLELLKSKKDYLKALWAGGGWNGEVAVWRLEFQFRRAALVELGVLTVDQLNANLAGLWGYATQSWLRLAVDVPWESNRSRWPTHPLWEQLAAVDWGNPTAPLLTRYRKSRVPSDDRLFVNGLGGLTSFMAREGITDLAEGIGEFLAQVEAYHDARGANGGRDLRSYVAQKVAVKATKYNTLRNESPEAAGYRKASDGE